MAAAAPPATVPSVRQRVQEASNRIRRVKLFDRLATGTITFGGLFIIVAVLFIFLFILGETLPLSGPRRARRAVRSTSPRYPPRPRRSRSPSASTSTRGTSTSSCPTAVS